MSARELRAGEVLGRYELLMPIAKGGMAQVWAARLRGTRGFQKVVAMKTILSGVMDDANGERMFLEEASLASQIHHPNVIETLDLGDEKGTLYLVMEWVEGESLQSILRLAREQGGMPIPMAVNLIGQACKGLHAAHELRDDAGQSLGLVHRDISPHNILVTYSGTVKLVDFGIAKATHRAHGGVTEAGQVKGKFSYMAPESMRRQAIDRRSDIFAMGIVLYQMTTGVHPFRGDDQMQTIQSIASARPPALPSTIVADYPQSLERVVMKALAKYASDRWASAHDMLAALEDAMPGCLEASFETEVQTFLKQLLGDLAGKRRAALREAQDKADRQANEDGSWPKLTQRSDKDDSRSRPAPSEIPTELGAELPARPRLFVGFASAASVLAVIVIGFLLLRPSPPKPADEPAAPVAAAALPTPPSAPVASISPAAEPTEQPSSEGAAVLQPTTSGADRRSGPSKARERVSAPKSSPPGVVVKPAETPQQAGEPTPKPTKPKPAVDAWDPSTFGGRQ